jgi:hypothetical protein
VKKLVLWVVLVAMMLTGGVAWREHAVGMKQELVPRAKMAARITALEEAGAEVRFVVPTVYVPLGGCVEPCVEPEHPNSVLTWVTVVYEPSGAE